MHIFLQKWGSLSQTSKPLLDLPLTNHSVVLDWSNLSRFLRFWACCEPPCRWTPKWHGGIWMFQNDWPDPSIPWQTANRHLLLGRFCQVQTLRPKTQQLCSFAETRSFGIVLRCSFTWGWTICLFGHEAEKSQGKTSLKPEILRRWMFIAVVWDPTWFQRLQFLTHLHLPTLTWRRGVLMMRRESSCSSNNGVSNCTHSTAVKPRSKPQNGMLRHMVPHPIFPTDLGGSQLIPGFPWGAQLGWKACSIFQPISSRVGPGVGLNGLNTVFNV